MRINLAALPRNLSQRLAPLYHLFGAETLLLEEALDQIRQRARAQGFTERIRYSLEPGFNWDRLLASGQTMSLFAERKIIEMRMPSGKPGTVGAKALIDYVAAISGPDTMLLLLSGVIDKSTQNSKWFKAIEAAGVVMECPSLPSVQLPDWIKQRMRSKGLNFDVAAAERLSHFVEGNLLAAAQAIDLLILLSPQQKITAETVENAIADHTRFTVYTFADACLAGVPQRCTRILQSLRRNQVEPILVLWALTKETRTLCQLAAGLATGMRMQELLKQHRIWSSRSGLVNAALRRLSLPQWETLLRRLARADLMLKGRTPLQRQNIWEEIESISLRMCGLRIH